MTFKVVGYYLPYITLLSAQETQNGCSCLPKLHPQLTIGEYNSAQVQMLTVYVVLLCVKKEYNVFNNCKCSLQSSVSVLACHAESIILSLSVS